MEKWQQTILLVYAAVNLAVLIRGYVECKYRKNAYGLVRPLGVLGIFAWGDAVIFGPFWIISVAVSLFFTDWYLFLLIVSVFWLVRSLGETIYWFNQQFSSKVYDWNKPENLSWHSIFRNDSIWYVYQIGWQCVNVAAIIFTIYLAKLWLDFRF